MYNVKTFKDSEIKFEYNDIVIEKNCINHVQGISSEGKTTKVLDSIDALKPLKVLFYNIEGVITEEYFKEHCKSQVEMLRYDRISDFKDENFEFEDNSVVIIDSLNIYEDYLKDDLKGRMLKELQNKDITFIAIHHLALKLF